MREDQCPKCGSILDDFGQCFACDCEGGTPDLQGKSQRQSLTALRHSCIHDLHLPYMHQQIAQREISPGLTFFDFVAANALGRVSADEAIEEARKLIARLYPLDI